MESVQNALVHTYNPAPIVLDHGEGAYLYDTEGKAYLDFAAGYAVNSLGYGNEEWNQALKSQIDHLAHTSNLYYHTRTKEAAEALKRVSGMDRIFFCNSGGEAIEGALKASRKYAYTKKSGRYEWIAMEESFHGRGFGAVSVTGHKAYQEPFEPLVPGVRFAKYNDLESVNKKNFWLGYITPQMYQEICDKGAVGALFARFFDEAGNEIDCTWNHCCVSFSFKHIINVPNVVCIASGIQKAKAVSIAIQKKYINTLITDGTTASAIMGLI